MHTVHFAKGDVLQEHIFEDIDQAKLFIDELIGTRIPKVITDEEMHINALRIMSSTLREIMLTEVDFTITLDSKWLPHINTLKRRRAPTTEQQVERKKRKVKRGAYVTIATIAQELNKSPRDCRAALRKLKTPKPEHGWAWPPHEAQIIKTKLAKRFKRSLMEKVPVAPLHIH